MITVGLPTWANKDIIWLPLEGLCRQRTGFDWELIVAECDSLYASGFDLFAAYWPRLQEAGCKRLLYMFNGERIPLGQKWKVMAQRARGGMFLLQASDEYPHDTRLQVAGQVNAVWYDTRFYYSYSLISKKMLFFDRETCPQWLTGNDMALKTDILRGIPDNRYKQGVDFFLFNNLNGAYKVRDSILYPGLHTNGANTISMARERFYEKPEPPFAKTVATLEDVGLPDDIIDRLEAFTPQDYLDKMRRTSVDVRFMADVPGTCKGQERTISADAYMNLRDKCILLQDVKPNFEKEL